MCKLKSAGEGVNFNGTREELSGCMSCAEGKQARKSFNKVDATINTSGILDLLHMDVCGPMATKSHGNARYFVSIIDDFSRKVFVSFLTEKSAVVSVFRAFKQMAENQSGRKVKRIRSDNGKEFVNSDMAKICTDAGIVHEKTPPYTPQHNGVAERMNRTIVERARCMLADAGLGNEFWAEAIQHACFLVNRSVNRTSLKIFGTHVMVHVPEARRRKWDKKATEMIFVGYPIDQSGYRCFNPSKPGIVISSRDG